MESKPSDKSVLLISMPFASVETPSIQLGVLESYLRIQGVNVESSHLYLKAAEIYGVRNYNHLIYPPNTPYNAQMVYSRYVFPEHWRNNLDRFKEYYVRNIQGNSRSDVLFSFEEYVDLTDRFYQWVLSSINWSHYDIIGFTLNYGQLLPSLAVAKRIKEMHPDKIIILGGSRVTGDIGVGALRSFPYIDFVVSGEGEYPLCRLAKDYSNHHLIPGLIHRSNSEIIWNRSNECVDINNLPVPEYDSFYHALSSVSSDIHKYYRLEGRLPVEISRGCWWNKCTFCNLNIQYPCYREKNTDRIIYEIETLSDKYRVLRFHLVGNTLPKNNYQLLLKEIKKLGKDLSLTAEVRSERLKRRDYQLLSKTGFKEIQTGVESFSGNYLKKMNKGLRVIDNIAALKFCKEYNIKNHYNIIVNYPNEDQVDFEETVKNTQHIRSYIDPPQIVDLVVCYGSIIYNKPEDFNIEALEYTETDKLMFPPEILRNHISFYYTYKRRNETAKNNWLGVIEEWKRSQSRSEGGNIDGNTLANQYTYYYTDGGDFLIIYDKRSSDDTRMYILDKYERMVLLSCLDIASLQDLKNRLSCIINEDELRGILDAFVKKGILYEEDGYYLTLPMQYNANERDIDEDDETRLIYKEEEAISIR